MIELLMINMGEEAKAVEILRKCNAAMPGRFDRMSLFAPVCPEGASDIRYVHCPFLKGHSYLYNVWVLRELHRFLEQPWGLIIHVDGYILNPHLWTDDFLNYDYIGAPWPWNAEGVGGNGGFCLRSKRLWEWISTNSGPINYDMPEDYYFGIFNAEASIKAGFRYAPREVAAKFSYENDLPDIRQDLKSVFGFHGKHHLANL